MQDTTSMLLPTNQFGFVYRRLLGNLLDTDYAIVELNARTNTRIAVLPGAQSFQLDLSNNLLPLNGLRKTFPRTAAVEVAWFLRGSRDVTWLEDRGVKIWSPFAVDGTVTSAYGYRWRSAFGRDQIAAAIHTLQKDPSSRQVYITAWSGQVDGLGNTAKNIPCPVGFTLSILNGQLHSTLLMRSSDVFVGLPYDVMGHAMLLSVLAGWIDSELTLGTMTVTFAHAHLYEDHWDMASKCISSLSVIKTKIPLLQIKEDRPDWDFWIAEYAQAGKNEPWPEYNPKPRLVE